MITLEYEDYCVINIYFPNGGGGPVRLAYKLVSGLPVKAYESEVTLTPTASGGTTIRWRSTFTAAPVVGPVLRRVLGRFIATTAEQLGQAAVA